MRGRRPVLMCDADDGMCGTWDVDSYEENVSTVTEYGPNGPITTTITAVERAPGWLSTMGADYCPEHKAEAQS